MIPKHSVLLIWMLLAWLLVISGGCFSEPAATEEPRAVEPRAEELRHALFDGDESRVKELLENKGLADTVFASGDKPLHAVAQVPILEPDAPKPAVDDRIVARLMRALLEAGADPDSLNSQQLTPLMVLAISGADTEGRVGLAAVLIDGGANIDLTDDFGNTALVFAAQSGRGRLATFLLERGADNTLRNRTGETATEAARRNGHVALAELLSR